MRLGVLFVILSAALAALGLMERGWGYIMLWPALSLLVVGAGYLGLGARVFGKRADGSHPFATLLFHAPYRFVAWVIWQALRRGRVKPYALVSPGLYLARRLHHHELPEGVEIIVDLTAEFAVPDGVPVGRTYHALPALDTHVPDEARWNALVDEIAKSDRVALVHCAAGHGRSAAFVAAVLIRRGLANDVDDAERIIKLVRPSIGIRRTQRALVAKTVRGG